MELVTAAKDINAVYEAELRSLAQKPSTEPSAPNAEQKQEDYYKVSLSTLGSASRADRDQNFRTNVLLAWTISNAALAAAILQVNSTNVATTYMGIMLL